MASISDSSPPQGLPPAPPLPEAPIDPLTNAFRRFLHTSSASGIVLMGATLVALVLANSPLHVHVRGFWDAVLTIGVGELTLSYPLWYWVNDGLMTIFFFVIGLEIKRELVHGELSDKRKIVLPVVAAIGGAAIPAIVFRLVLGSAEGARAWAVPMATDIAFVVGVLALLGKRVPPGLKIFLLSLAIVDDIIAVLVIALFYSAALSVSWLVGALAGFGALHLLQRSGVRAVGVYSLVAVAIWVCTLKSGIHPTVAGVFLGLLTPSRAWLQHAHLRRSMRHARRALATSDVRQRRSAIDNLRLAARESVSPLERLERTLHPWVAFGIMPLFALANAGVSLRPEALASPLAVAIAAGLVLGKTIGVSLGVGAAVRLGGARLPEGMTGPSVVAAGLLAGLGFTMSLFIASLGLEGASLEASKGGILIGSLVAGIGGYLLLRRVLPDPSVATMADGAVQEARA